MKKNSYKFIKPIKIDGDEVAELNYDFDSLTGEDVETIMIEIGLEGRVVAYPEFDSMYHAALFAKAAGVDLSEIKGMGAKDFMRVGSLAKNFFFFDAEALSQMRSSAKQQLKSQETPQQPM